MSGAHAPDPDDAIGRSESLTERLDLRQARHMEVTLDRTPSLREGDPLPPFWHYLYFNPRLRASELGPDGHEKLGRFIPDFGLPRRMWGGGRVRITAPLRLGEDVTKTSTIRAVEHKTGRSGRLCIVTVDHDFTVAGDHRLTETQNIVYREAPGPGAPAPAAPQAPGDAQFSRRVTPDPVLLFRYSALIFYGHRIHYDADYARDVEGYPGLVFHGPLTTTLLVGLGLEHLRGRALAGYEIRAMSPLFVTAPFMLEGRVEGDRIHLWARGPDDSCAMTVTLETRA